MVWGVAGQGKTALLDELARRARSRDMTVLRATGVEIEHRLAFSGLTAVLRPLRDAIGQLSAAQAAALRGVLGIDESPVAPLAAYAATLTVLAAAGEE